MEEGVPIFRASATVQTRIETLLAKQQATGLSAEEEQELDSYEGIDDYLSFVNRVVRNLAHSSSAQDGWQLPSRRKIPAFLQQHVHQQKQGGILRRTIRDRKSNYCLRSCNAACA
jgi:hypothetical protein